MGDLYGSENVNLVSLKGPIVVRLVNDTEAVTQLLVVKEFTIENGVMYATPKAVMQDRGGGAPQMRDCTTPVAIPMENIAGWTTIPDQDEW